MGLTKLTLLNSTNTAVERYTYCIHSGMISRTTTVDKVMDICS
jgi:hypothetical protein